MRSFIRTIGIPSAFAGFLLLAFLAWNTPGAVRAQGEVTPTPTQAMPPQMFVFDKGILIDLPPDATQAQYGAEVYRLVCSACHAYDGTGLTDKWRSGWAPEDQNCWQSKCHGPNHPSDGFYMPFSPPVVGGILPAMFADAQELYEYNLTRMPWHDPGMLTENEAWAVTSHLLRMNGYEVPDLLGPDNAAGIDLRFGEGPQRAQTIYMTALAAPLNGPVLSAGDATQTPPAPVPTADATQPPAAQPPATSPRTWIWALPIATAVLLLLAGAARHRKNPTKA